MNIKNCYNSEASQNTYLSKTGLMPTESAIFSLFPKHLSILDLGCGGGRTTAELYNRGFHQIIGVDFAEKLILGAKEKYPDLSDLFHVGDATDLNNFKKNEFDIVFFSFNGIDYIQSRELRLIAYNEINRVLKKGGFFIFSSHNKKCLPTNRNLLKTILKNLFHINNEYWKTKQSFGEIDTYYSTEKQLTEDLLKNGFEKILVVPNNTLLYPFLDTFPYYIFKKI